MIGRKIILDGIPHEVIAITPPDLRFARGRQLHPALELPERADVFLPIRFTVAQEQGSFSIGHLPIARLKPGVTPAQARAELDHSLPTFQFSVHVLGRLRTDVQALETALIGDTAKPLWLLLFAVGFVLLIACVNVANLSLMRMAQRARELSIRVALGATRLDLIRYALAESVLVALAGTASGVVLSLWITDLVVSRAPSRVPRLDDVSPDTTIFIFAVALCALTIVLFGMLPAWRVSQVTPQQSINAASRGNTDTQRGGRIRAVLVSTEVALGTLLTIGSGLLLISLHRVINVPKGFEADNVLVGRITLPPAKYQSVDMMQRFLRGVLDQVSATPGVVDVAATTILPLEPEFLRPVVTEHSDAAESGSMPLVTMPAVSSEYIKAMGIPLRQGRFLRENEPEPVAIVNESAARLLWPGETPIGKRIARDEKVRDWLRVVGVTGDILSAGLDRAATPAVYTSYSRYGLPEFSLVVRSAGFRGGFSEALRQAVSKVDAEVPVAEIRTMSELLGKWSH
jgi:putative ABC transport system permease protein